MRSSTSCLDRLRTLWALDLVKSAPQTTKRRSLWRVGTYPLLLMQQTPSLYHIANQPLYINHLTVDHALSQRLDEFVGVVFSHISQDHHQLKLMRMADRLLRLEKKSRKPKKITISK